MDIEESWELEVRTSFSVQAWVGVMLHVKDHTLLTINHSNFKKCKWVTLDKVKLFSLSSFCYMEQNKTCGSLTNLILAL